MKHIYIYMYIYETFIYIYVSYIYIYMGIPPPKRHPSNLQYIYSECTKGMTHIYLHIPIYTPIYIYAYIFLHTYIPYTDIYLIPIYTDKKEANTGENEAGQP